jgi:hypothetical protein
MSQATFLRAVSDRVRRIGRTSSNFAHPSSDGGLVRPSIVHRADHGGEKDSIEAWADVARRCGTDQVAYMPYFWEHFHSLQHSEFTLLEIGVYHGQSLEVWKEMYPKAKIYALDINPDCAQYADPPRVKITIGSQADPHVLDDWLSQVTDPIDVIIDDGSHVMEHLRASFTHLFPKLRSGGVYVLEDLGTCYIPEYGGALGNPGTMIEMLKSFVDDIHSHWSGTGNRFQIEHIHFYGNICFVYKF